MIQNPQENIAIFGWSFNPPTLWHKIVMREILTSNTVSKVIFSPDWVRLDKNYSTSRDERLEINKAFYDDLIRDWLNIDFDNYFLNENPDITCTIEAEKYFTEKLWFQPYHIFWIDVIKNMPNWRFNNDRYIEDKLKKIFLKRAWYGIPIEIKNMQNYVLLDFDIPQISSTMVRNMIKTQQWVGSILTPGVHKIIKENNLYTN